MSESTIVLTTVNYKDHELKVLLERKESCPDKLYAINNNDLIDPEIIVSYLQEHWGLSLEIAVELVGIWNKQARKQKSNLDNWNKNSSLEIEHRDTTEPVLQWSGLEEEENVDIRDGKNRSGVPYDLSYYLSMSGIDKTNYSKEEITELKDLLLSQINGIFNMLLKRK